MKHLSIFITGCLIAGCGQSGSKSSVTEEPLRSSSTATTPSSAAPAGVPASPATQPAPAVLKAVDVQANHPNGTTMRVTGVQLADDHTALKMSVTNGYKNAIQLNANRDMVLQDSLGNNYFVAAPPENPQISIAPGSTVEGTFTFLGRLNPAATSATLVTNERLGSPDFRLSGRPQMRFQIPISR